jgi:hypothetical protein
MRVCLSLIESGIQQLLLCCFSFCFSSIFVIVVIVPFIPRLITGPNVCPASVDTLTIDSFVCGCTFSFSSHCVTNTLFHTASISAVLDCVSGELFRFSLSPSCFSLGEKVLKVMRPLHGPTGLHSSSFGSQL